MTQSSKQKSTKIWLVESSASDQDSKKFIERMGMTHAEFATSMGFSDAEHRHKTKSNFVWPRHTFREIRDPMEVVYQHDLSDPSWSVRYKALGCYDLPSLTSIQHRENPKNSENISLFPDKDELSDQPIHQLETNIFPEIEYNVNHKKDKSLPLIDDITFEQRRKLIEDLRLSDSDDERIDCRKSIHDKSASNMVSSTNQEVHSPSLKEIVCATCPKSSENDERIADAFSKEILMLSNKETIDLFGKSIKLPCKPPMVSPLPTETLDNIVDSPRRNLRHTKVRKRTLKAPLDENALSHQREDTNHFHSNFNESDTSNKPVDPVSSSLSVSKNANVFMGDSSRNTASNVSLPHSNKENLANSTFEQDVSSLTHRSPRNNLLDSLENEVSRIPDSTVDSRINDYVYLVLSKANELLDMRKNILTVNLADDFKLNDEDTSLEGGELEFPVPFKKNGKISTSNDLSAEPARGRNNIFDFFVSPLQSSPIPNELVNSFKISDPIRTRETKDNSIENASNKVNERRLFYNHEIKSKSLRKKLSAASSSRFKDNTIKKPSLKNVEQPNLEYVKPSHSIPILIKSEKKLHTFPEEKISIIQTSSSDLDAASIEPFSDTRPRNSISSMPPPGANSKQIHDVQSSFGEDDRSSVWPIRFGPSTESSIEYVSPIYTYSKNSSENSSDILRSVPREPWVLSTPSAERMNMLMLKLQMKSPLSCSSIEQLSSLRFFLSNLRVSELSMNSRPLTGVVLVPSSPTSHSEGSPMCKPASCNREVATLTSPVINDRPKTADVSVQFSLTTSNVAAQVSPKSYLNSMTNTTPKPENVEISIGTSPTLCPVTPEKCSYLECLRKIVDRNLHISLTVKKSLEKKSAEEYLSIANKLKEEATIYWGNVVAYVMATSSTQNKNIKSLVKSNSTRLKPVICSCGDGPSQLHFFFSQADFINYPKKMLSSARNLISAAFLLESSKPLASPVSCFDIYNKARMQIRQTADRMHRAEGKLARRAQIAVHGELSRVPKSSLPPLSVDQFGGEVWSNLWYSALERIDSILCYREYQLKLDSITTLRHKIENDSSLQNIESSPLNVEPLDCGNLDAENLNDQENGVFTLPISTVKQMLKFVRSNTLAHEFVCHRQESEKILSTSGYSSFSSVITPDDFPSSNSPGHVSLSEHEGIRIQQPLPELPIFVAPNDDIGSLLSYIDSVLHHNDSVVSNCSACPELSSHAGLSNYKNNSRHTVISPNISEYYKTKEKSKNKNELILPNVIKEVSRVNQTNKDIPSPLSLMIDKNKMFPETNSLSKETTPVTRIEGYEKKKSKKNRNNRSQAESDAVASLVDLNIFAPNKKYSSSECDTQPIFTKTRVSKKRKINETAEEDNRNSTIRSSPAYSKQDEIVPRLKRSKKICALDIQNSNILSPINSGNQLKHTEDNLYETVCNQSHTSSTSNRKARSRSVAPDTHKVHSLNSGNFGKSYDSHSITGYSSEKFDNFRSQRSVSGEVKNIRPYKHDSPLLYRNISGSKYSPISSEKDTLPPTDVRLSREADSSLIVNTRPTYSPTRPECSTDTAFSLNNSYKPSILQSVGSQYIPSIPKPESGRSSIQHTPTPQLNPKTCIPSAPSFYTKWLDKNVSDRSDRSLTSTSSRGKVSMGYRPVQKPNR